MAARVREGTVGGGTGRGRGARERERKRWRRERGRGKGRISLRLFFLNPNDYIASLFIVLRRLAS